LIFDCILGALFDVSGFFEMYRGAGVEKYAIETYQQFSLESDIPGGVKEQERNCSSAFC